MPTRTGKANQPTDDESPDLPAVPKKSVPECVDQVQKMSEDESDTVDDTMEKAKEMSDAVDDSTEKPEKMSDVVDDSIEKPEKMSDVVDDSTEKTKKMSDVKEDSTKKAQDVQDSNEDSSEKAQETTEAADDSPEEAQKMSEEESEAADEATEDVLLDTLASLDSRILLIPVGKNKVGELYWWQPSYPSSAPPPKNPASGSLKWHQKSESNTLLLDASLAISEDYRFLHAVVDDYESAEGSPSQRIVWRKPTSKLAAPPGAKETVVWQARTALSHSSDLAFHVEDIEQRKAVLMIPFNPDAPIPMGVRIPGSEEGSLSGNQSPKSAEASSETETSDDMYSGSSPKKPRLE